MIELPDSWQTLPLGELVSAVRQPAKLEKGKQ
jgi:hypothetical protein